MFYGPEKFDLLTYYNYITSNLKLDMVIFVMENAGAAEGITAGYVFGGEAALTNDTVKVIYNIEAVN